MQAACWQYEHWLATTTICVPSCSINVLWERYVCSYRGQRKIRPVVAVMPMIWFKDLFELGGWGYNHRHSCLVSLKDLIFDTDRKKINSYHRLVGCIWSSFWMGIPPLLHRLASTVHGSVGRVRSWTMMAAAVLFLLLYHNIATADKQLQKVDAHRAHHGSGMLCLACNRSCPSCDKLTPVLDGCLQDIHFVLDFLGCMECWLSINSFPGTITSLRPPWPCTSVRPRVCAVIFDGLEMHVWTPPRFLGRRSQKDMQSMIFLSHMCTVRVGRKWWRG